MPGAARVPLRVRHALWLGLLLAAPAGLAQQADTYDAQWSRVTSGAAQTSTSTNGEFSAEGTIGVPESPPDRPAADVFDVEGGFVAGIIPPGVTTRPDAIFASGYED